MPFMMHKVAKPVDLSWDAFPAPTPEAEKWQPDPDSVPVAGGLPHPRVNKDKNSLTVQQEQALKRDKRLGLISDSLSESTHAGLPLCVTTSGGSQASLGNWPAPAPRATGLPREVGPTPALHPLIPPIKPPKPVERAPVALARSRTSAFEAVKPSQPANGYKGTMETLPVQLPFQRPHTPPRSVAPDIIASPVGTPPPAWARSLAYLLEDSLKFAPLSQNPAHAAIPATSVSRPPHLRKQAKTSSSPVTSVANWRSRSDNVEGTNAPQNKTQSTNSSAAVSLEHTRHKQDTPGASRLEPASTVEKLELQKSLLESFIPKKPVSSQEHERYLQAQSINFMEDEMDLSTRMTRRELSNMSKKEFDAFFAKTQAMHKLTWDTK